MASLGKEHGDARAEALVASYDGVLLAGLLKPARERRAFLSAVAGAARQPLAGDAVK